jgi:pSer/pThr/pTyr-binding forkhead associated (FHA) protein
MQSKAVNDSITEPEKKRLKTQQGYAEDSEVWAKLSSITSQTTKSIPANKLKLRQSEFRIGRNDQNDLQILNPLISGHHATISKREMNGETTVLVTDLSSNGTFINGVLVSNDVLISNADR